MEEVLLVVAIVGGIAWWMHSGTTPAQGQQTQAGATEQVQPASPTPPAAVPPAPANTK